MNISDNLKFYLEISRVLKKGGALVYFDVFKKNGDTDYPVPWADTSDISFLHTIKEMVSVLDRLGFKELIIKDQSLSSEIFLQKSSPGGT